MSLEKKQRLYDSIKDVKDEYTRKVLYSQFVDKYYVEAFDAIQDLFFKGQVHRNKKREQE
jgi:hypothetical protein